MNTGIAAAYAALAFLLFCLPCQRMLSFADRQCRRGPKAVPAFALGIILARAAFFAAGLAIALLFALAMPDGLALGRIAAAAMIALWAIKGFAGLRRPFPGADNDNIPKRQFLGEIWSGMRNGAHPYAETALAASALVFFVGPAAMTLQDIEKLAAAHLAASLGAVLLYTFTARPVLTRLNRRKDDARRERIARLLRSGLPRVSARFRQDAA